MYTQIDSLARTVNGLVVENTENINKMVGVDVFTKYALAALVVLFAVILLMFVVWGGSELFSGMFYDIRRSKKAKKVRKIVTDLYKNTSIEKLFESSKLRKYQLREFVVNMKVKDTYVNDVTDAFWNDYKSGNF